MTPPIPVHGADLFAVSPLLIVVLTAMIVLMVDLGLPRDRKSACIPVSLVGLAAAGVACYLLWSKNPASSVTGFAGTIVADDFALAFQAILLVVAALSIMLSQKYIEQKGINHGEYYALLLFSTSGAMLMATARELITIFIGLEVLSIALYILSGFARTEARSEESAMKYFLLGSFSSAFFLYGIALVYGGTGTTRLDLLATQSVVPLAKLTSSYAVAGFALLLIGLAFKAAIVPFHSWTPDVYEGAPTSVTAFMSAGAKCGAFAALIRVAIVLLPLSAVFHDVFWVLAILTMVIGNFVAIVQTNIKRMLAYSSIAHAGYILVGLLAGSSGAAAAHPSIRTEAYAGILFYVLAYTFMNLGAFGVLILLARRGDELNNIEDLQGLAQSRPWAAGLMALFMFSLAGVPPAAGFFGKFYVFIAAVDAHQYTLAVIGLVASVVGAAYYLRIIYTMCFLPAKRDYPANIWGFSLGATVALFLCAVPTLFFGVLPGWLYNTALVGSRSLQAPTAVVARTALPAPTPVEQASVR